MKKRLIALLLILALAAALCACGKADPAQSDEKYAKYDSLIERIEAGDYDGASACLRGLFGKTEETQQPEQSSTGPQQTETEPQQTEPAPSESTIEINLDNWQEYFEFRLGIAEERNSLDELKKVLVVDRIWLKENWADAVVDANVTMEIKCTDDQYYMYSYNYETQELVRGRQFTFEELEAEYPGWNGQYVVHNKYVFKKYNIDKGMTIYGGWYEDRFVLEGNTVSFPSEEFGNVEIIRMEGTLTVRR